MCKTVIRNVLLPLVARYGESIGLWREDYRGHGLEIWDDNFTEFLDSEFHEDFHLKGRHCNHIRDAITSIKKEKPSELSAWIQAKLRKYVKLKTAVSGHSGSFVTEEILV